MELQLRGGGLGNLASWATKIRQIRIAEDFCLSSSTVRVEAGDESAQTAMAAPQANPFVPVLSSMRAHLMRNTIPPTITNVPDRSNRR
jgi:hypothetical protein